MSDIDLLRHFLETTFCLDGLVDWDEIRRTLSDPNFLNRGKTFKQNLADAISNNTLTVEEVEKMTSLDFESQEEVSEFLQTQIWQPLYGDEPVTLQKAA